MQVQQRPSLTGRFERRATVGVELTVPSLGTTILPRKTWERINSPGMPIEAVSDKQRTYAEQVRFRRASEVLYQAGADLVRFRAMARRHESAKGPIPTANAVKVLKMLRNQYRQARAIKRMTSARAILDNPTPTA